MCFGGEVDYYQDDEEQITFGKCDPAPKKDFRVIVLPMITYLARELFNFSNLSKSEQKNLETALEEHEIENGIYQPRERRTLRQHLINTIKYYQEEISPELGKGKCEYTPTCSEYARIAVEEHGVMKGSYLAVRRLLRCNHLSSGGHDPVPVREVN